MDSEGVPTTDTKQALNGLVMPLGGYKGSGLAMMVEILCAVLSGGAMSTELGGIRIPGKKMRVSQTYLAIDVQRFLPAENFQARMDRLIQMIKSAAPARDYDEVLIAGEPETRTEERRSREGIPIAQGNWRALVDIAARLSVEQPIQRTTP
ncbi:MAG: Ldh family oxidoreductase, partial [Acidobacteriota bacterium]|nr:Ldh family oxidoreductase [Acidobacteriota bacterium]